MNSILANKNFKMPIQSIELNPRLIMTIRTSVQSLYLFLTYHVLTATIPVQFCAKFASVGIAQNCLALPPIKAVVSPGSGTKLNSA